MDAVAKTRILVVDDHLVAREGLKSLLGLQPDMEVVGEARDGAEAITAHAALRPDVVLMDMRLPRLDGVGATFALLQKDPATRILILSSYETNEDIGRAYDAGALGYVLKRPTPRSCSRPSGPCVRAGVSCPRSSSTAWPPGRPTSR